MNEIENMFLPNEEIYINLQEYIKQHFSEEVWVGRNKITKEPIMITFKESKNVLQNFSTTKDNSIRTLDYEIDIYCGERVDSYEIVNELSILVVKFMQGIYKMNGGLNAILPIYDGKNHTSYQASLRFSTNFKPNENKLF